MLWGTGLGMLMLGALTNPLLHQVTGALPPSNARPRSGFWTISIIAIAAGLCLILARRHRGAGRALAAVLTTSICLGLAETAVRLAPPFEIRGVISWEQQNYVRNRWGFPDGEPRPDSLNRVLVLGDSITYGIGDDLDQTCRYPDIFETALSKRGFELDVQIVATGNTQFDAYVRNYEKLGPEYRPNVVVIGWCLNDIEYGELAFTPALAGKLGSRWPRWIVRMARPVIFESRINELFLFTVLHKRLSVLAAKRGWSKRDWLDDHNQWYHERLVSRYRDPRYVDHARTDLAKLAAHCREHDRKLLVVIFPFSFTLNNEKGRELFQVMTALLESLNVPYLNLLPVFNEQVQRGNDVYSYRDACHPNVEGHRITGDLLVEALAPMLQTTGE
jgi:lysophospholipase L1-like esterase